jgi:hypothetical protein
MRRLLAALTLSLTLLLPVALPGAYRVSGRSLYVVSCPRFSCGFQVASRISSLSFPWHSLEDETTSASLCPLAKAARITTEATAQTTPVIHPAARPDTWPEICGQIFRVDGVLGCGHMHIKEFRKISARSPYDRSTSAATARRSQNRPSVDRLSSSAMLWPGVFHCHGGFNFSDKPSYGMETMKTRYLVPKPLASLNDPFRLTSGDTQL